ncbi:Bug family tripartite tricarboxylate transporter substrate binding protein [Verticiella sediminum]|nr:tripartite tricarboxylate transporter substrate-binding protein [Verticiella sediminum]
MQRRTFLRAAGLACASPMVGVRPAWAAATSLPQGPITVIVPFTAGGSTDTSTRVIMRQVQENTGLNIIVENRPGGGTRIGTDALVRAAPDGRTLALATNNLAFNETLYEGKLNYRLDADIAPVSLTHSTAHTLLVHPAVPANTFEEFIEYAKQNPGVVTFGSAGIGTTNHLCGEYLKSVAGIDMLHVPYQGISALMPDLYSGRVLVLFASLVTALEAARDKRMKLLAVTTEKRQSQAPDVPAIAEFYPEYAFSSWIGYMAPGATPKPIVDGLSAEFVKAVKTPGIMEQIPGFEPLGSTPEAFRSFLKEEVDTSRRIIQSARIEL